MRPREKPHAGTVRRGEVVRVKPEEGEGPRDVGKGPRLGFGRTGADPGGQRAGDTVTYTAPTGGRAGERPSRSGARKATTATMSSPVNEILGMITSHLWKSASYCITTSVK